MTKMSATFNPVELETLRAMRLNRALRDMSVYAEQYYHQIASSFVQVTLQNIMALSS